MEIGFLEEIVNAKAGAGEKNEVNLEHLTGQKVRKCSKYDAVYQKDTSSSLKGLPNTKYEVI